MSQYPFYKPLPSPKEMNQWDKAASELCHLPPVMLMENASREAFFVLSTYVSLSCDTQILVIMGSGNNGGDGAALARHLHNHGCDVLVLHTVPLEIMKSPAKEHCLMAKSAGVSFLSISSTQNISEQGLVLPKGWHAPTIIVDALLGTGITEKLRPTEEALIRAINSYIRHSFLFSLDIPSGLNGLTGRAMPIAVKATATVTFEAGKPGLFMPEAKQYVGQVHIRSIGIPAKVKAVLPASWQLLSPSKGAWAKPSSLLHKGKAGTIVVIGGSSNMAGAPLLSCLGVLRTGAGVTHLLCPNAAATTIRGHYPEVIVTEVGEDWNTKTASHLIDLLQLIQPAAIVVGPGMGKSARLPTVLSALLGMPDRSPVVLDADALLSSDSKEGKSILSLLHSQDILTPHPGEMARIMPAAFFSKTLSEIEKIAAVQRDRAAALKMFTGLFPGTLILKGAGTLVGQQNHPITLSPVAEASLAVPGSGDVLTGVCAALLGFGMPSYDAASLAVYLHAQAGVLLSQKALRGHLAHEIADTLPAVWAELSQ